MKENTFLKKIQLIGIYLYAFCGLNATIFDYLDDNFDFLVELFPFINYLGSRHIQMFQSSEKSIFMHLLIIDILTKTKLPLSIIVKFNIVLILILEMFMTVIIFFWDLVTAKDIKFESEFELLEIYSYYDNLFYISIWIFYFILYLYCFVCAIQEKYPKFPGFAQKLIESINFYFYKQNKKK